MSQIESFIPFWEWDLPKKKKAKKIKEDKGKGRISGTSTPANGTAQIEEVPSGDSRPQSRAARVEDANDDDS